MHLTSIIERLKSGHLGFKIDEEMSGEHWFEPSFGPQGARKMVFRGSWGPENIVDWIRPSSEKFLWQEFSGSITIEGLCQDAPANGSLELGYFDDKKIRYTLEFEVDGVAYRFVGEKVNIRPWNLPVSHTTCFGTLIEVESGKLVSTSVTHFRLSSAPRFLTSLRLV